MADPNVTGAVSAVASKLGVTLTDEQASTISEQAALVLRDLIMAALDKKVAADEAQAVSGITTLEAAEADARKPR